jgi:hypothetical protein
MIECTIFEGHETAFSNLVAGLLGCAVEQVVFPEEGTEMYQLIEKEEELWDLPDDAEVLLEMDNVTGKGMAYGYVALIEWRGKQYVAECNASPYLVYQKK